MSTTPSNNNYSQNDYFYIVSKNKLDQKGIEEDPKTEIPYIHQSVGWGDFDNRLSLQRLSQKTNKTYFLIAKETNQIKGYVTIKPDDKVKESYYISFIAIHADSHGKRGGEALMRKVFQKAIKANYSVRLECEESLKGFYGKFKPSTCTQTGMYMNGEAKLGIVYHIKDFKGSEEDHSS